jgi:hypothetical protein
MTSIRVRACAYAGKYGAEAVSLCLRDALVLLLVPRERLLKPLGRGGGAVITSSLANGRWWSVGRRSLLGPNRSPHTAVLNTHGASYSLIDTLSGMRRNQSLALGARHIPRGLGHAHTLVRIWAVCHDIRSLHSFSSARSFLASRSASDPCLPGGNGMEWRSCHCSPALATAAHTRRTTNVSQRSVNSLFTTRHVLPQREKGFMSR